jgi:hypothetical protein
MFCGIVYVAGHGFAAIPPLGISEMFILRALNKSGSEFFYTGRADADWVSRDVSEAFTFDNLDHARRCAMKHNEFEPLHGLWFIAKPSQRGED